MPLRLRPYRHIMPKRKLPGFAFDGRECAVACPVLSPDIQPVRRAGLQPRHRVGLHVPDVARPHTPADDPIRRRASHWFPDPCHRRRRHRPTRHNRNPQRNLANRYRSRGRVDALVMALSLLAIGTVVVIIVTLDLIIEKSVSVLAIAGRALLRRSPALVVVIEHLTSMACVICVTRVMSMEMLTSRTSVICVASVVSVEMLTCRTRVVCVTSVGLGMSVLKPRSRHTLPRALIVAIKHQTRRTRVVVMASGGLGMSVLKPRSRHTLPRALIVAIKHQTRRTRVVVMASGGLGMSVLKPRSRHTLPRALIVAIKHQTRRTRVVVMASGVGVLSAGTWRAGSVDASRGNPLLTTGTARLMPTSINGPCPAAVRAPFLRCR